MGYYIETGKSHNKLEDIMVKYKGERIPKPTITNWITYRDLGQAIICIVNNTVFEAAAFAFSPEELTVFTQADDLRYKCWLIIPWKDAVQATGFRES